MLVVTTMFPKITDEMIEKARTQMLAAMDAFRADNNTVAHYVRARHVYGRLEALQTAQQQFQEAVTRGWMKDILEGWPPPDMSDKCAQALQLLGSLGRPLATTSMATALEVDAETMLGILSTLQMHCFIESGLFAVINGRPTWMYQITEAGRAALVDLPPESEE